VRSSVGEQGAPQTEVGRLWIPAFDGVRGLIALSIAMVHITLAIGWLPQHESLLALRRSWFFSIEFLFLVGGMVAMLPVLVNNHFGGARAYALGRLGRILPLYYLTIALALVLGPLLRPVSQTDFPHDLGAVLAHLTFTHHMVLPFRSGFGVQGIVWTMTIAAAFYVTFPLIAERWRRHPWVCLGVAAVLTVAWREALGRRSGWYSQFPLFAADFGIGMTAAHVYVRYLVPRRSQLPSAAALAALASLSVGLLGLLYASGLPIARGHGVAWGESSFLALAVPFTFAALLLTIPLVPGWAQAPLSIRPMRFLGRISYGLFLFHFLTIWLVLRFVHIPRNGSAQSVLELAALVLPITIIAAWLGTRFVERPIRMRTRRLGDRFRHPAPAPSASAPAPAVAAASTSAPK
jgi:peptidoglycan/LPS O-acetylase OafA/YrhL